MKAIIAFAFYGVAAMSANHASDLADFRKNREETLKKEWLTVVGLTWLKEGANSIGSKPGSMISLPSSTPATLGTIWLEEKKAELELIQTQNVSINGKPAVKSQRIRLTSDLDQAPTMVTVGRVSFFLIDRPSGLGVRVRDTDSPTLKNFKSLNWWENKPEYRVTGIWKKIDPPMKLMIPDVTGHSSEESIGGSVTFKMKGQELELFPTRKGHRLFFVFKDETSGKSSYGTGRFLFADLENEQQVVLDFNKAHNPPCAYIHFATCPIAPSLNRLRVAIEAGEKSP